MTHGSVFSAAGQAVTVALRGLLPGWSVLYQPPMNESEMVGADGCQVVYVDPEGDSEIVVSSIPRGWTETCPLTVVFHRVDRRGHATQAEVDDQVAEAVGELLEWVTDNHRPPAATPAGWDSVELRLAGLSRQGGYLEGASGPGRRVEVTVTATATRC